MKDFESTSSVLSQLLEVTSGVEVEFKVGKDLEQRLTGRFYTPELVGRPMAKDLAMKLKQPTKTLRIIDPFCGDGRLVCWLIEELGTTGKLKGIKVEVALWDCDQDAVVKAGVAVRKLTTNLRIDARVKAKRTDSFSEALITDGSFDICVTNPPWETIKPDTRELSALDGPTKEMYIRLLKEKVLRLEQSYPHATPARKFSGWGANLARCGVEASVRVVREGGYFGIVAPATIFGDQISAPLRVWLMGTNNLDVIHHYPASARLFDGVDQSAVYLTGEKGVQQPENLLVVQHTQGTGGEESTRLQLSYEFLRSNDYAIGFSASPSMAEAMQYLGELPKLGEFEAGGRKIVHLGRELDETRIVQKLSEKGKHQFIKGKQVQRFSFDDSRPVFIKP